MNTTPEQADQACENENKYAQFASKEDPSRENPYRATRRWGLFSRTILAFVISYISFLYFSGSPLPFLLSRPEKFYREAHLNEITSLSINIDQKVIQASSLKEQTFPMLVSRSIQDLESPSPAPVDLICVFDFSKNFYRHSELTHHVENFFQKVFPLMNDQDRLSIVLLDGLGAESPVLSILPFAKTTKENQEKTLLSLLSLAADMGREKFSMVKARVNIFDQREGGNEATGIFLFSEENNENVSEDFYKMRLGLQSVRTIARSVMKRSSYDHTRMIEDFTNGLNALRNHVVGTIFSIGPEESQFFKGIKIIHKYQETPSWREQNLPWEHNSNGTLYIRSSYLKLGHQEKFLFDLEIPKIPHDLHESPMEVKIASCQQVYVLLDGAQVVKNTDLVVKIVREGEEI